MKKIVHLYSKLILRAFFALILIISNTSYAKTFVPPNVVKLRSLCYNINCNLMKNKDKNMKPT